MKYITKKLFLLISLISTINIFADTPFERAGKRILFYSKNDKGLPILAELVEVMPEAVNYADHDGNTPLMQACQHNAIRTVKFLLKKGADINAINQKGHSALMIAVTFYDLSLNVQATNFILSNILSAFFTTSSSIPNIDAADVEYGNTALHMAVNKGNLVAVEFLVRSGATLDKLNGLMQTPLDIAKEKAQQFKESPIIHSIYAKIWAYLEEVINSNRSKEKTLVTTETFIETETTNT